ncbi:DEAD/DEAH box helicase [Methylobacter tundripaludum]|uniref:DEAD/DEAH box helicase n=1 Tax=Methylobacter tundripaludum TaxID=173365 RepID=UPI00055CEBA8|nr:DEAD/DEAH box helicase family protein [Methylobacter tundripaludum]
MSTPINGQKIANQLAARLSLRSPQRESLDILVDLLEQLNLSQDPDLQHWLTVIQQQHPTVKDFERTFPSLCFALATGVGKTRLMGAMITWLYLTGRSRHFLVLAPNLTIYEKLKQDFTLGNPKYVFAGIPEISQTPPVIITGEDYESGRGVRLDYAVPMTLTADLFAYESAPHINIFNIAKINARDTKKGAAKSSVVKVRRLQEYIGDSYFDYLAELPDLVVLMDEAHRYYASAGAKAINDLKPVLGIELTATPKTTGAKPRDFANIIYHYPLASALNDGFVKIPAVATRKDFRADQYSSKELEKIKLEDGIHHHEYVKVELQAYASTHQAKLVKPFMLVVAQDTSHAGAIKALIENDLFEGRYKGKVIEVHSNQSGEESDEAMQRLLAVEHDDNTEIVIHVNKLKEGWDVTNLYTIVPLRASASEILTEQTIGRGLRLPYGKRTGVEAVDRLTIIAHDRFQEIIDRANDAESIIRKTIFIGGDDADIPDKKPQIITAPSCLDMLTTGKTATQDDRDIAEEGGRYEVKAQTEQRIKVAEIVLKVVEEQAAKLASSKELSQKDVQAYVVRRVQQVVRDNPPMQRLLPELEIEAMLSDEEVADIVYAVTEKLIELTLDVPKIVVLPTREVNYGFQDFDLQRLEKVNFQPVSQEILLQHLDNNQTTSIHWAGQDAHEEQLEDYLVRNLMDKDEIDYDEHAGLLYKLTGQLIAHLRSYLSSESQVENVLIYWQKQLGEFIWAQMREHQWTTPTDYIGKVIQGFDVLKPATFTLAAGEQPRDFRAPIADKRAIRQMVFKGFIKCCYPYQKFDSVEGEWRLAQLLEDDEDVLKWMKPASGQFRIEYQNGQNYEPDFVVECAAYYLLVEPKRADQINTDEVQLKARAASRWCGYANEHAKNNGNKLWFYLLIPHDAIMLGRTLSSFKSEYSWT